MLKSSREETNIVKNALTQAGYTNVKVKHGTGTACGWLKIWADFLPGKGFHLWRGDIIQIAQAVTGRHGDYSGEISVHINLKEDICQVK